MLLDFDKHVYLISGATKMRQVTQVFKKIIICVLWEKKAKINVFKVQAYFEKKEN